MPLTFQKITKPKDLRQDDIVVALVGPTGSGKTNFVDILTGRAEKRASPSLTSCADEVSAVRIMDNRVPEDHIVLIDTPGFDDTNRLDFEIFQMIFKWLKKIDKRKAKLTGMLYLHRITDNRMGQTPLLNLKLFEDMFTDGTARNVVLVTTMWDVAEGTEGSDLGKDREDELKMDFWKGMIASGATTARFMNTQDSAWRIVEDLAIKREDNGTVTMVLNPEERVEAKIGKAIVDELRALRVQQSRILLRFAELARAKNDTELASTLNVDAQNIQTQLEEIDRIDFKNCLPILTGRTIWRRTTRGR